MNTDTETIEHLDFSHTFPCESDRFKLETLEPYPDCLSGESAVWIVERTCCTDKRPKFGYFCDPCLQFKLANPAGCRCPICFTQYVPSATAWKTIRRIDDLS